MIIETITPIEGEQLEEVASGLHGFVGTRLARYLSEHVDDNGLGYVVGADTEFEIPNIGPRKPDVAFVSIERMPEPIDDTLPFAPDLAGEVMSRTDGWNAAVVKARMYLQAGTRLVWIVDPYTKSVFVFRPGEEKLVTLSVDDELSGESVIPNFKLKVNRLFELPKKL